MSRIKEIRRIFNKLSVKDETKRKFMSRILGCNDYAKHDRFLYVTVPEIRKLAKDNYDLKFNEIQELIQSEMNEERLLALIILVNQYKNKDKKNDIFNFYVNNLKYVNNWNLVDSSAQYIIGPHLFEKLHGDDQLLYNLAKSTSLWDKRVSIISSWHFIKNKEYKLTLSLAEILLNDEHHLIHKAVGWMLREIGKKDQRILTDFLDKHSKKMPRIMLRYSIEKLNDKQRKFYLSS